MINVGVAGFGTIGKRVTRGIEKQPDMRIAGVAKTSSSPEAELIENEYGLFGVSNENVRSMESAGHDVDGDLEQLASNSDIVVDCSPSGYGEENKSVYVSENTPAVFQGGEKSTVAQQSFNSYVAKTKDTDYSDLEYLRVVSCNTTGLSRVIKILDENYGVNQVEATLMRRAGDPGETSRGPINEVVRSKNVPSHHAEDVNELLPEVNIHTMAVKVPTTSMHMHSVAIDLDNAGSFDIDVLDKENRICFVPRKYEVDSAGDMGELANLESRPYGSIWENTIWRNTFRIEDDVLRFFQGIHQRSITVPETIDAVRAVMGSGIEDSIDKTDRTLGVDNSIFEY